MKNAVLPRKANQENSGGAERRREETTCPANLPETLTLDPSWLRDARATGKDPESDQLRAKQDDWPETTRKLTPLP